MFDVFAELIKATANGRRLELLELLAQGEHSVEQIARMTGRGLTTVSAHLQTLHHAGLVSKRRERTKIFYRLSGDDVAELFTAAKRVALNRHPRLQSVVDDYLDHPQARAPVVDPTTVSAEAFVIDVRPLEEYEAGHYVGAVSLPLAEIEDRLDEIPSDREVVIYCRGQLCRLGREAAALLRAHGFDAKALNGGVMEWRANKEIRLDVA